MCGPARSAARFAGRRRRHTRVASRVDSTANVAGSNSPPPPDFGAGVTPTVTDWFADPPGPVQVNVKVTLASIATATPEPLVGSLPAQPLAPLAVQAVAFVVDQLNCTD